MHLRSYLGKLTQLRSAHPSLWLSFVSGWLCRQRKGFVPCVIRGCRKLLYVPAKDFYDSYSFFCEDPQGRSELGYFMNRIKPGDVVYDIGAFRGVFSAASKLKLQQGVNVHAFEPIPQSVEAMERIRALNHFSGFEIIPHAVGEGRLEAAKVNDKDGMLHTADSSESGTAMEIRTLSIDQYIAEGHPAPSLMKIDVEGYELQVLKGARQCLAKSRPQLWLEVHPEFLLAQRKSSEDVLSLLRDAGYTVTFFDDYDSPNSRVSYHVWCV